MAKILIIEDDSILADDLKFFIGEEKHSCQIYTRADDVMNNIENLNQFDWIILDIMMLKGEKIKDTNPDKETGEVLYEKIREKCPQMKVLVLSAKDFNDMTIDFNKEHNVRKILKPVTETKLRELLNLISGK